MKYQNKIEKKIEKRYEKIILWHISEKGNSQTFEIFAFICHVTTVFHKPNMPVLNSTTRLLNLNKSVQHFLYHNSHTRFSSTSFCSYFYFIISQ